jgi:sodium transport system ATP-binding protein
MTIEALCLRKEFYGHTAVHEVSFRVAAGEVYGLIGPNGAGKTTTMRMLVGLMRPTSGQVLIEGQSINVGSLSGREAMGFVSGSTGLYERLTPREMLRYQAALYGMHKKRVEPRIAQLSRELHFEPLLERRCGKLSSGERQRVSLARATIHDPRVLVLDEPTVGLDVVASRFVARFIERCRAQQRAVLLSTHYLSEAELLCDRIGLLDKGRILVEGTPKQLKAQFQRSTLEEVFLLLHGDADQQPQEPSEC